MGLLSSLCTLSQSSACNFELCFYNDLGGSSGKSSGLNRPFLLGELVTSKSTFLEHIRLYFHCRYLSSFCLYSFSSSVSSNSRHFGFLQGLERHS